MKTLIVLFQFHSTKITYIFFTLYYLQNCAMCMFWLCQAKSLLTLINHLILKKWLDYFWSYVGELSGTISQPLSFKLQDRRLEDLCACLPGLYPRCSFIKSPVQYPLHCNSSHDLVVSKCQSWWEVLLPGIVSSVFRAARRKNREQGEEKLIRLTRWHKLKWS